MWNPLLNADQLSKGSRLRLTILEGSFQHESIYKVTIVGQNYFMVQLIEQNGIQLPEDQQSVTPYKTQSIIYYGFEIWTD